MKTTLRSHLTVLGLVIAVLAAVFGIGYTHPIRLGLDLQGGLEVVLQAVPSHQHKLTQDDLTKSLEIIRSRVDSLGVSEPEIRPQGTDQIAIELPGEKDPDRAVQLVGSTAQLHFYDFQKTLVGGQAYRTPYDVLKHYESDAKDSLATAQKKYDAAKTAKEKAAAGFDETWFLFDAKHVQVGDSAPDKARLLKKYGGKLPTGYEALMVPVGKIMVHGKPDFLPVSIASTGGHFDKDKGVYLLMKDDPALSGSEIRNAVGESSNGEWVTSIQFTGKGGRAFQKVTKQIAREGALQGHKLSFAIVLDDEVKSAPTIDYNQYPQGIGGGAAQITGLDSRQEAQDLALVLNTGALPVKFDVISKSTVSATLGSQSLRQGLLAGGAGLLVVMVYLILFYRFLGLIADVALVIYAFIFYGLIVGIPITMTLPGIAGMILTIAVAADANIIIFERIREEYRAGRSVGASIQAGYNKGLRTIIDANIVTIITALVLFIIATGTVKGFALLLFIGTMLSMFTAIAATYAMLGIASRIPGLRHPVLMGLTRHALRFRIPWMKAQRWMFAWTAFVMVASVVLVSGVTGKHLNLGVDFKSGTKFDVVLAKKVDAESVRSSLAKASSVYKRATIQKTEQPKAGGTAPRTNESSFTINVEKVTTGKGVGKDAQERKNNAQTVGERKVLDQLDKDFGVKSSSVTTIGPSFGKQVRNGAIVAIIVSLLLEVLYIALRFDVKYSIPVMVALAHDIVVSLGAYALTGREFKSATVAALLTILGYSLYDTIIVFDRIRENIGILRKSSFAKITDTSLNEVITRSINTTLVVLGPISALYFFGGETLKDFAYALLIGIFAGAYSSVIVASPILCWMKEREPAWARRRDGEDKPSRSAGAGPTNGDAVANAPAGAAGASDDDAGVTARGGAATVANAVANPPRRRDTRSRSQRKK